MARGQRGIRKNAKYNCDKCGILIEGIKAYYILQHQNQNIDRKGFCSKECAYKDLKVGKIKLKCKCCSVEFEKIPSHITSDKVFCSSSCSAKYNNAIRYLNISKKEASLENIEKQIKEKFSVKIKSECLSCNKLMVFYPHNKHVYCSVQCKRDHDYALFIKKWLSGDESATRTNGMVSRYVRRFLIEESKNKCSKCGWDEVNPSTKKCPLQVDHIDGNSENSKRENLRVLCPNCHSLTPTHGNLNRGNGRKLRKDRYALVI